MSLPCIIKRVCERYSPYIQIIGFVPVMSGIIASGWMAFSFGVSQTQAFTGLQADMQKQHEAQIITQQEVHDIWRAMRLDRIKR